MNDEKFDSERPTQATRQELAEAAREHYDSLSRACCDWLSTIPQAITAWEREPELLERIAFLEANRIDDLAHQNMTHLIFGG